MELLLPLGLAIWCILTKKEANKPPARLNPEKRHYPDAFSQRYNRIVQRGRGQQNQ